MISHANHFPPVQQQPENAWSDQFEDDNNIPQVEENQIQQKNAWTQDLIPIQQEQAYHQNLQATTETVPIADNYRKQNFFNSQREEVEQVKVSDEYGENNESEAQYGAQRADYGEKRAEYGEKRSDYGQENSSLEFGQKSELGQKTSDFGQKVPEYGQKPSDYEENTGFGQKQGQADGDNEFREESAFKQIINNAEPSEYEESLDTSQEQNVDIQVPNGGRFIPPPSNNAAEFLSSYSEDDIREHTTRHWMGFMSIDVEQNNCTISHVPKVRVQNYCLICLSKIEGTLKLYVQ